MSICRCFRTAATPTSVAAERLSSCNYFSGTAVAIRPGWFPPAAADGHTARQKLLIADIVSELSGVVRWGGTFDRAWESHFQIDVAPDDPLLDAVASRINKWRDHPDQGAGALAKGS
jgi:hypothetical protein